MMKCDCNQTPCCCRDRQRKGQSHAAESGKASAYERNDGYEQALDLLHQIRTPSGFVAAPSDTTNYRRIWSRDGVIIGLAALASGDLQLIDTLRQTLLTLAQHQSPRGHIPSNVDTVAERVSYGGTTGRVDADLWFIIGCAEYGAATEDTAFLDQVLPALEKVDFLLRAWEFNERGLLFVPPAGDWADEYIQSGYVLYDQLLYLQAHRSLAFLQTRKDDARAAEHAAKADQLEALIRANYWFQGVDEPPEAIYHPVLYQKGYEAPQCRCRHWVPFFSPHGYGYRFDAFANVLASLLGVANESQRARVDDLIADLLEDGPKLLPAFHPVIRPIDEDWERLQVTFSYTFRNQPYEFHNGGLWPMVTGFYVADLAARGKQDAAQAFLRGIHWANALPMDLPSSEAETWSFPEFVHGRNYTAGGTRQQGWSAAAAVIGYHAIQGKAPFRITGNRT